MDILERAQQRAMKMIKALEYLILGEAVRAGTVEPGEDEAQRHLMDVYKYLMGENKNHGARLFLVVSSERKRGNGHKRKYKKFPLNK